MSKNKLETMQIGTLDDIFSTEEERQSTSSMKVQDIPIELIDDFPNQPFKVRMDEEMAELAESISKVGVLLPVLVRPKGERYEMVSGHRRKAGSEMAELKTVPAVIRDLNDDEAIILLVDSNLQRTNIVVSEKAWAYKLKYDALKHQGKRNDLTSGQVVQKLSQPSFDNQFKENDRTIRRYIRLTNLLPDILEMVDKGRISLIPAEQISYLEVQEQKDLLETMLSEESTPSLAQATKMHQLSNENALNMDTIFHIMSEKKPNQAEKITIKQEKIKKYFPASATPNQKEETIMKLLEQWYRKKQKEKER